MTWAPGGRGGTAAIGLAVGPAGRMVVAFFRQGASRRVIREVVAAVAPPRHRLGPFDVIGQHGGIGTFSAAVTARGRVAVAWGTQDGGEEANRPYRTYAALARPDGRFAAPSGWTQEPHMSAHPLRRSSPRRRTGR